MDTVFFDMDGTLIDTEKYYNVCWCEAIAKFGYTITKEEALDLRSLGRPHVYRFFEEKYGKGFPYDEMRAYRKKIMEEMLKRDGITVKPGAKEILLWLKSRQIRCMIATATDLERTNRYLEMAGLSSYFDEIISAVMVKNGKRHQIFISLHVKKQAVCRQIVLQSRIRQMVYVLRPQQDAVFS